MKIRIFDNDNDIFEYLDLSKLDEAIDTLKSYEDYFSPGYLNEQYTETSDGDKYSLPTVNRHYFTKDSVDYYVGDLVEIKGSTINKNYITELVLNPKTHCIEPKVKHFRFDRSDMSYYIIKKVGTIYDEYLKK